MDEVTRKVSKTIELICVIFLLSLLFLLAGQVVARFLPFRMMSWVDEIIQLLFAWFVFLGATVLVYKGEHLSVDIFESRLQGLQKDMHKVFVSAAILITGGFLTYAGGDLAQKAVGKSSPVLALPYYIWYMAIPVGGILLVFFASVQLYSNVKELRNKSKKSLKTLIKKEEF